MVAGLLARGAPSVLDRSLEALRRLNAQFGTHVTGVFSTAESIEQVWETDKSLTFCGIISERRIF